ncbi:cell division topological specificity factor MinE [Succinimonas sp.]|uniref:cell division topological specificity factor MinE n=1 Tax=Succinimonas sp. TaxID=1936151 RepID=UPI00386F06D1|nr:cell division topological specificity factor MinE [Succinimonas sp.]
MSWLTDFFMSKKKDDRETAKNAKDRLRVLLVHDRENRSGPDFLPQLKLDILAAIKKYVQISDEQVQVNVSQQNDTSMMEVSVSLDPKYDGTAPTGVHERYSTDEDINSIKPITEEEQA